MLTFVNAKINLGLNIVGKRDDGYHLLETVFYPVGRYNGTPACPDPFCDLLELTRRNYDDPEGIDVCGVNVLLGGRQLDCPPEKNLVARAVRLFITHLEDEGVDFIGKCGPLTLRLKKRIPDGAGMGGGSADATFTLIALNEIGENAGIKPLHANELEALALKLGADCPFFVDNHAAYGRGVGEVLEPMEDLLKGMWLAVVKPALHIPTADAFADVTPRKPEKSLPTLLELPMAQWRDCVKNDFEQSLFPKYPELKRLKDSLYEQGAEYASLTGSGAALYGIFSSYDAAKAAVANIGAPYGVVCLL